MERNKKEKKKTFYKLPLILGTSVFSLSMIGMWFMHAGEINSAMYIVGGIYAIICFIFLVFQIISFAWAHLYYDEDVEGVKFKVLEAEMEEGEWKS